MMQTLYYYIDGSHQVQGLFFLFVLTYISTLTQTICMLFIVPKITLELKIEKLFVLIALFLRKAD